MTAPDLRPNQPQADDLPMKSGQNHQLEHQMADTPLNRVIRRELDESRRTGRLDFPEMSGDEAAELLAKVLPAGGPILGGDQ